IDEALSALEKAAAHKEPPAPWVINWLTGEINARNGMFDEAIENFQQVLDTKIPDRKIDLSLDYIVINELARACFDRAQAPSLGRDSPERREYLTKAIAAYRRTLAIDSEDVTAHYGLARAYSHVAWGKAPQQAPPVVDAKGVPVPVDP